MSFQLLKFTLLCNFLSVVCCHESGSAEANKLEITPYYDTIIISDVADIINDLAHNMNPLESILSSGSESEENIEDLLYEYQHYLEKAHKQRMNYLEKSRTKNKVPLARHDRYARTKPAGGLVRYEKYYQDPYPPSYMNNKVFQPQLYSSPLDIFGLADSKFRYMGKPDPTTTPVPKDNRADYLPLDKRLLDLSPLMPKEKYDPINSSCFCKNNQLPCECNCKQCLMPFDSGITKQFYPMDLGNRFSAKNAEYTVDDRSQTTKDDFINLRIKVEVQLPEMQENIKNHSYDNTKEMSSYPFPYFNVPIPLNLFGYKKSSKMNSHDASHKITIHKKKKSRNSGASKKHKKKVITFHNLNMQSPPHPPAFASYFDDIFNNSDNYENLAQILNQSQILIESNTTTEKIKPAMNITSSVTASNNTEPGGAGGGGTESTNTSHTAESTTTTDDNMMYNKTQTESVYVTVNITDGNSLATNKINSIEMFTKNEDTEKKIERVKKTAQQGNVQDISRKKRAIAEIKINSTDSPKVNTHKAIIGLILNNTNNTFFPLTKSNETKKADKALLADAELIYWPNNSNNQSSLPKKNITTLILEREKKRTKFNMTKESIKNDHTRALEKAIFGEVDWDDVDTVAPMFMSFVGKYLKGVLTFCSQSICHSMKCEDKTCIHRICNPSERWNQKGHCTGSHNADSVASLESLMDLPSNVAFEIVDILQDKMPGKLFGKTTLCINSKCISLIAMKKNFLKSKCSLKELNQGYCPNLKNMKMM